jgi:predicted  nucleic acid-binding Zn-ribbon protein
MMSKKKTHEEYVDELKTKNPYVKVVGKYIDAKTNIMHQCLIHNILWETKPSRVLNGHGCKQCRIEKFKKSNTKTQEEYIEAVKLENPNIEVVGKYANAKTKILHKCLIHNVIWDALPTNILKGCGCCECMKEKISNKNGSNHSEYVEKLLNINPNIIALEEYVNTETKIKHKCKVCEHEWSAKPANILAGKGCPKCNESHGEKNISNYLNINHIDYIPQHTFDDCKDIRKLPFDFYIPELNMCIEYDGEQHFKAVDHFGGEEGLKTRQFHDQIKTSYCEQNNILLLRIKYDENIEEKIYSFIH